MEKLVAVRRRENRRDRIASMHLRVSCCDCEQMKIVVAEDGDRGIAKRLHLAQHGKRFGTAIDEIADQPQPVGARRETDQLEQLTELRVAALDVADRVMTHRSKIIRAAAMPTATGIERKGVPFGLM